MQVSYIESLIGRLIRHEMAEGAKPSAIYMQETVWLALAKEMEASAVYNGNVSDRLFAGVPVYTVSDGRHPAVKII